MADRTVDEETDDRLGVDRPGPDGVVDDYDNAQGLLHPGLNGNISTKFPPDGKYVVELDACAFEGGQRFSWSVDGGPAVEATTCTTEVRLSEGRHEVAVTVGGSAGDERESMTIDVRDLIVVGLGDSYSAGSGASRTGLVGAAYDNIPCTRTGHSGQARAALAMERLDGKTSVTFIQLACGGARAELGLLGPHNGQKPQLLELSEILPPGQAVDLVTFTIGGNDVHFSDVVGQLVIEHDAPLSLIDGERTHDRVQRELLELRERMPRVAACLGAGVAGQPCEVYGPSGRDDDRQVVRIAPIPLAARDRVVAIGYPDLTRYLVRRPSGDLVFTSSGPLARTCPSGAAQEPGDLTDGVADGLVGGRPGRPGILSEGEWTWGDAALLQPEDPAPDDDRPFAYAYRPEGGGEIVALPLRNTLNSVIGEWGPRFGWTTSMRWWEDSHGHGYCSADADNWFFRSIFHPRDSGYIGEAAGLLEHARDLGVVYPR